jgi:8-oxo-dGTP pyrophosphatase MutT (NUDIX family)
VTPPQQDDPFKNPWTQLSRRQVYENPWITVFHDEVLRPDGQPGTYGVVRFRNYAVGVVAIDEHDRVLLVGQFRYSLNQYSWEIPEGGAVIGEEEPLACARRELEEETGYTARDWREILHSHLSNSVSDELGICFLATWLTPGVARPDGTERLQVRRVPFEEALRMTVMGEITDSLTMLGLQRAALLRAGMV